MVWPGCTHSRHWEGHHCRHWADGGATNLDNVVGVCRYHHRLLHEGGYFVVKDADEFVFCRPDGSLIPPVDESLKKSVSRAQRDLTVVRLSNWVAEDHAVYRIARTRHTADPPDAHRPAGRRRGVISLHAPIGCDVLGIQSDA